MLRGGLGFIATNAAVAAAAAFFLFRSDASANPSWITAMWSLQVAAHYVFCFALVAALAWVVGRFAALTRIFKRDAAYAWSLAAVFSATQFLLVVDLVFYRFFHFHLNGMALWVLKSSAGRATLGISTRDCALAALCFTALLVVEAWAARKFLGPPRHGRNSPRPRRLLFAASALALIVCDKTLYAYFDITGNSHYAEVSRSIPLYQGVTMRRFVLHNLKKSIPHIADTVAKAAPARPMAQFEEIKLDPQAPRPSVLLVVVDSWRADTFTPTGMPKLWKFSEQYGVHFTDHLSGGNSTRDGIFSLLYGHNSVLWGDALARQREPLLFSLMRQRGYTFAIRSSASLDFPEFRRTAFAAIDPSQILDAPPGEHAFERDRHLAADLVASMEQLPGDAPPRFDFLLLDAPHNPYTYAPEFEVFKPSSAHYLFASLFDKDRVGEVVNRYRNAVLTVDDLLTGMLTRLGDAGKLDNRIVVITGDHGEEFYDNGHWGHFSAFTRAQLHVPFLWIPPRAGNLPEQASFPVGGQVGHGTSHLDVAPTLARLLGMHEPEPAHAFSGKDLGDDAARPRTACGWNRCAVLGEKYALVFGSEPYNSAVVEIYDGNYKRTAAPDAQDPATLEAVGRVLSERRAF